HFEGADVGHIIGAHSTARNEAGEDVSLWVAKDFDRHPDKDGAYNVDAETLLRYALVVRERALELGFDVLLEDSDRNGGLHLWVLFSEPCPTAQAHAFGEWLTRDWKDHALPEKPETFPKQPKLSGKEFGNWLRLPGRHHTREHWSRFHDGKRWLA